MKKHRTFKERSTAKTEKSFLFCILLGMFFALLSGVILLAISCFPAMMMEDPTRFAPAFAIVSLFLATIFGAYLASRLHRKNGFACGAVTALLVIASLVLLSFAFSMKIHTVLFAICAPALVICSMIAGITAVSTESTPKTKHKIKF